MSDLINRQDAIGALKEYEVEESDNFTRTDPVSMMTVATIANCIEAIEELPSAEPERQEFEWCHDCKEYDQEKHCCHRWTKVIRNTVEEMKNQGQWIPVTEALPKMKEVVLITNGKGHVRCGKYQGIFDNKNYRWWWKHKTLEEVLAWQSLPEPWENNNE